MNWKSTSRLIFSSILAVLLLVIIAAPIARAQQESEVSKRITDIISYYIDMEYDKGITLANDLLTSNELEAHDSVGVYAVLSMLTIGKGESYLKKSYDYLEKMADIGPCKIPLPYEFWPQELRDHWYKIAQVRDALNCPDDSDGKIQTIAIMEFDNYSVGKYQEELGFISKGLAEFFESDFKKISELKIVERDKVDFLLGELSLSESGKIEKATAVKVGKMLGAQIMVFGSIMQLDGKNAKMLVKAVKVETSEIIAIVEQEGKPDYFKMQKALVKDLAIKLDLKLNEETVNLLDKAATESYDAATLYSKGLYFMDKYDYKQAYEHFKKAYEMDNSFAEAKRKMDIYRPLAIG